MTAIVEPLDNPFSLLLGQRLGGNRFLVTLAYNGKNGIELVDGLSLDAANPTIIEANLLTQNKRSEIIVTVREKSVDVSVDGREVIKWTGDASSLSANHESPNAEALMLHTNGCRYRIHRLSIEPLSGAGRILTNPPTSSNREPAKTMVVSIEKH